MFCGQQFIERGALSIEMPTNWNCNYASSLASNRIETAMVSCQCLRNFMRSMCRRVCNFIQVVFSLRVVFIRPIFSQFTKILLFHQIRKINLLEVNFEEWSEKIVTYLCLIIPWRPRIQRYHGPTLELGNSELRQHLRTP